VVRQRFNTFVLGLKFPEGKDYMPRRKDWKRETAEYVVALIIAAAFFFMFISLAAVLDDPKKGPKSSEAASWVQAIGSISAIFGAFLFGERQAKHAHNTALAVQDRERLRKSAAFLAICTAAGEHVDLIESIFCRRPYDGFSRLAQFKESSIEQIIKALQSIPIHEVGSADAVISLLHLIENLEWVLVHIEAFDAALGTKKLPHSTGMAPEEHPRGEIGRLVEDIRYDYQVLEKELQLDQVSA